MLKIGICDDEPVIHKIVTDMLAIYEVEYSFPLKVSSFLSGTELLMHSNEFDLILLDIEMPNMDGIQIGQQLGTDYSGKIIMLTCKAERFKEAFKIGAFRFVTKPIMQSELFSALNDVRKTMIGEETVDVYTNNYPYQIRQKDIFYIEAQDGYTEIHCKSNMFRSEHTLNRWETLLDNRLFFRINRKHILNMRFITNIQQYIIILKDIKLPLARRRKKEPGPYFLFWLHCPILHFNDYSTNGRLSP